MASLTFLWTRASHLNSWQWFHNADAQWKTIIGALHYEQTQPSLCSCMVDGNPIVTENISPVACLSGGDDCTWSPAVIQAIARESDGIVLAESAMNFPGATGANRMEFTNHFQMRNSSATKDALLKLYNNGAGDQWFMTFEK